MAKIHALRFPKAEAQPEKKALKYLYMDADEDHVALQYLEKKGDIKKTHTNTVMSKLIYVYEMYHLGDGIQSLPIYLIA